MKKVFICAVFLPVLVLAQGGTLNQMVPNTLIPEVVLINDLKEEWHKVYSNKLSQQYGKAVISSRRLKLLWAQAERQAIACQNHWAISYAASRVISLTGHTTSEQDAQELATLKTQLDEAGCCALLPESEWYRVR